ncbi:unnamed protein product [Tilletia caries]|uniref:Uncharacterized protein n=1 Tax=Tilletia caries TaxID=13290 RepID=A0ABN7J587_9BASI|nr:unnamed protein product [Tilletia caries]
MPQHASASQTQTHGHATTMPGSSGDDVWECIFTSLQPYRDDLLKYGFRCDAKPRVKVEGGGVKVEGASSSKATNEIIEISSDEHSDAEPDAEGAEGAGPLSRKIAAVEAKAKKDKKRKLSGTSDSAGKERHAAPSATSKKGCGSTQPQDKVKFDPKNDSKKQICPVCNKKETPEPWSEDETGQGNGKLKSPV